MIHFIYMRSVWKSKPSCHSEYLKCQPWYILVTKSKENLLYIIKYSPMGLLSQQLNAIEQACVLCDHHILLIFFLLVWVNHRITQGLSAPPCPRFKFRPIQLVAFCKVKIAIEREEFFKLSIRSTRWQQMAIRKKDFANWFEK